MSKTVTLILAAVLVLLGGATAVVSSLNQREQPSPWAPFVTLSTAIQMHGLDTGCLPRSLARLMKSDGTPGWSGPYVDGPLPMDSWGQRIQYKVLDERTYELRSPGPDAVFDTPDDMVYTPEVRLGGRRPAALPPQPAEAAP